VLAVVVLVAITVLAYVPVFKNGFVWDDDLYLVYNPQVQAGITPASVAWAFTTGHASNWHPLTWMSLELDHNLFGMRPWGYHLVNLLLHVANALLLLGFLWKTTGAWWRSALVAALFALHPLHVESVAWLTERKDVLSTFFGFLALLSYAGYAKRPGFRWYLLLLLAYAASLLAKPMLVTLPFVLLLLDYWPLGRVQGAGDKGQRISLPALGRLVLEKVPLLVLAAASSAATWYVQQQGQSVQGLGRLPFMARVGNALVSYVVYLRKGFWPADLAALYPHPGPTLPAWQGVAAAVFLLAVIAAVIVLRRRAPYLAVGWFWYLGTLVPVIGIVQVGAQAYADRYTYVPLIGIFLALSWGGADLLMRWSFRDRSLIAGAAASVALLACALLTWLQVHYWDNGIALWEHAVLVAPSAPAYANLASALVQKPSSPDDEDDALKYYTEAVALEPNLLPANLGLATLLLKRNRVEEAVQHLRVVEHFEPESAEVKYLFGVTKMMKGEWPEAERYWLEAIRLNPEMISYRDRLAKLYADTGRVQDAIAMQRSAIALGEAQRRTDYLPHGLERLQQYERLQSKATSGTQPP
jgi:protein O-mannosyl-transferase